MELDLSYPANHRSDVDERATVMLMVMNPFLKNVIFVLPFDFFAQIVQQCSGNRCFPDPQYPRMKLE